MTVAGALVCTHFRPVMRGPISALSCMGPLDMKKTEPVFNC